MSNNVGQRPVPNKGFPVSTATVSNSTKDNREGPTERKRRKSKGKSRPPPSRPPTLPAGPADYLVWLVGWLAEGGKGGDMGQEKRSGTVINNNKQFLRFRENWGGKADTARFCLEMETSNLRPIRGMPRGRRTLASLSANPAASPLVMSSPGKSIYSATLPGEAQAGVSKVGSFWRELGRHTVSQPREHTSAGRLQFYRRYPARGPRRYRGVSSALGSTSLWAAYGGGRGNIGCAPAMF